MWHILQPKRRWSGWGNYVGWAMLGLPFVSKEQEQTSALSKAEEAWPMPTATLWVCRDDCALKNLLHNWGSDSSGSINGPSESWGHGTVSLVYFSLIVLNKFSVWEEGTFLLSINVVKSDFTGKVMFMVHLTNGQVLTQAPMCGVRCVWCPLRHCEGDSWWGWKSTWRRAPWRICRFELVFRLLGCKRDQMER